MEGERRGSERQGVRLKELTILPTGPGMGPTDAHERERDGFRELRDRPWWTRLVDVGG